MHLTLSRSLALASVVAIATAKRCLDTIVPVTISAQNGIFNLTAPASNIEVTNWVLNSIRQGHDYATEIFTGLNTISGTYNITATYCEPDSGPSKTIQILTHGVGFDRTYWDFSVGGGTYSYVNTAVDQYNFSTLAYDRLVIGPPPLNNDAVNEIQAPMEVAALNALTAAARTGSVTNCTFENIVHVGHSFGSALTYALAKAHPTASDGIILTGFSQNETFQPFFLLGVNLVLASNASPALVGYPAGYMASGSKAGVQTVFFAPGQFDAGVLDAVYAAGQPVTVGELLRIPEEPPASPFAGPVLIITGERDIPFCGGDCFSTGDPSVPSLLAPSVKDFPNATDFETIVVPKAGHGLNFEYSHSFTYQSIGDFLTRTVT